MKKHLGLALLASCVSFGASAQSFFDTFDNQTRLAQWSLNGTAFVVDAFGSDDYLSLPAAAFGSAAFTFNTVAPMTSVRLNMLYTGDGGTVQFSYGNVNQSVVVPACCSSILNPGPDGRTFSTQFFSNIPQGAAVTLRFTGGGIGMNLDNVGIQAVPEPGTYALMAAGLGILGFMARRRQAARGDALLASA